MGWPAPGIKMIMAIVVIWLVLAVACGWWAAKRGRSWGAWLVMALLVSPIVAGMVLMVLPARAGAEAEALSQAERCRQCDPRGERAAGECTHCLMSAPFHL